jgi:hypothetical protein
MSKKYKSLIVIVYLALIVLGCTSTKLTTTTITTSNSGTASNSFMYDESEPESILVRAPETDVNNFVLLNVIHIVSNQFDVYFDVSIMIDERTQMISSIFAAMELVPIDKGYSYIVSDEIGNWISSDIIHLNATDFFTDNNYFCFTLLQYYGSMSNYGLIYGYSQYLLSNTDSITDQEILSLIENNDYVFDLVWPLFLDEYVSVEVAEAAKSISTLFVRELVLSQGIDAFIRLLQESDLFENSFDTDLYSYLTQWLLSRGIVFEGTPLVTEIRYSTVSTEYPVKAETAGAEYYFCEGFLGYGIYGIALKEYQEVREYIETIESEMVMVRNYVDNDLPVNLYGKISIFHKIDESNTDSYGGYFIGSGTNSKILIHSIGATLHEYVHYATIGTKYSEISAKTKAHFSEGIAIYISSLYDRYWLEVSIAEYQIIKANPEGNLVTLVANYEGFLERNNLDFNMFDYFDCFAYTLGPDLVFPNYITSSSYAKYLIDYYGTELFWDYFGEVDTFDNLYGQSFSSMMDAWYDVILEKFQDG